MAELRTRRPPPPFRRVTVARTADVSPRLRRITLTGPELAGLPDADPAASVRLLLAADGGDDVVLPEWDGNEFLLADGIRPILRTLTPCRFDPEALELDVEVVLHGHGPLATWAAGAGAGAAAALSGTGRGYEIDAAATAFVLAGDESALPAIRLLLEALPPSADVQVLVEVAAPDGRLDLARSATWLDLPTGAPPGDALVAAVTALALPPDVRVWAAGEAAAMQRVRRHLFDEVGLPRDRAHVRGYWKVGRGGD